MGSKTTSTWLLGSSKKVVSESAALSLVVEVSLMGKAEEGCEVLKMGMRLLGTGCEVRTKKRVVPMEREENEEREVAEKAIAEKGRKKKRISHKWSVTSRSYPNSQFPNGLWTRC